MDSNYISLTQLGEIYGVAAGQVGAWLKGMSLRHENGWPSREAIEQGYVVERILDHGGSWWVWHEKKTCHELDMMGYRRGGQGPEVEEHDGFTLIRGSR